MAAPNGILYSPLFYAFGLFNWCLYLSISVYTGSFFRKDSEQDRLQLAIGKPFAGLGCSDTLLTRLQLVIASGISPRLSKASPTASSNSKMDANYTI
jgi:hypothetical protein